LASIILEFLAKCSEIYDEIASGSHRSAQVVVVPTSDSKSKRHKNTEKVSQQESSNSLDGVDSMSFYDEILHHVVHHSSTAKTIRYIDILVWIQSFTNINR
jgi:hypothetical protein